MKSLLFFLFFIITVGILNTSVSAKEYLVFDGTSKKALVTSYEVINKTLSANKKAELDLAMQVLSLAYLDPDTIDVSNLENMKNDGYYKAVHKKTVNEVIDLSNTPSIKEKANKHSSILNAKIWQHAKAKQN